MRRSTDPVIRRAKRLTRTWTYPGFGLLARFLCVLVPVFVCLPAIGVTQGIELSHAHPAGEQPLVEVPDHQPVPIDTYAGRVQVEWDPDAAVTPLGQMAFFIAFLKASGLFDNLVAACPLHYTSPNAPTRRDVPGTLLLSVLSGHRRYAHITALRADTVNPPLLGGRRGGVPDRTGPGRRN